MMSVRTGVMTAVVLATAATFGTSGAAGQEVDCLKCHAKLKAQPIVHAAVEMGCSSCHGGIDASRVPHKKTNKIGKGLSSDQPDLCYGCHDRTLFEKKHVHAAVSMGCTGCHDPHASKHAKLLKNESPELCFSCHDRKAFEGKVVHSPVAGGMCLSCHGPHSSDNRTLLTGMIEDVCAGCHADVLDKPHAIATISSKQHPLTSTRKKRVKEDGEWKEVVLHRKDPADPSKPFDCVSCHRPHAADTRRLLKFGARSSMELCSHCHKI